MTNPFLKPWNWWRKKRNKLGLLLSFGLTTYKALDYRRLYIASAEIKDELHDKLDAEIENNKELADTYNNVLLQLSLDSYQIDDIALPFWYKIYDPAADSFRMVRFNKAYATVYGKDPSTYFAKPDNEVIGEVGKEYQQNDRIAYNSGKIEVFYERYADTDGKIRIGKFAKWRVDKMSGTYIFGIQLEL